MGDKISCYICNTLTISKKKVLKLVFEILGHIYFNKKWDWYNYCLLMFHNQLWVSQWRLNYVLSSLLNILKIFLDFVLTCY